MSTKNQKYKFNHGVRFGGSRINFIILDGEELYQNISIEDGFVYAGASQQENPNNLSAEWKISRLSINNISAGHFWAEGLEEYIYVWGDRLLYGY